VRHANLVFISTRETWRAWLDANHAGATEVWLAYAKKHTGKARVVYQDAVDEALCFGWIDSIVRRVDDAYYSQRFTPRRPGSEWSQTNRARFRALVKEGRMTAAGLARKPPRQTAAERAAVKAKRSAPLVVPGYITGALRKNRRAREYFERMAPGQRRLYVGWINSAKKDETKRRRLTEAVARLAKNLPLGMK
jgi:uncharacterized protein YdeI (YjbR/CyaY-like superfamily)